MSMFDEFYTVFADDVQFGPLAPTGQHFVPRLCLDCVSR
jgi:hypothetical protein